MKEFEDCQLCPRKCHVNRHNAVGFCGVSDTVKLARAALHYMEEPCISGTSGSGTVFFGGCNLKCVYCQNYRLSHENYGVEVSVENLSEIFLELQRMGANNINLVTGVMYIPQIMQAIDLIRKRLTIPIVYNSSGYENAETVRLLKGYIDIYLVDIKYYDDLYAIRYSGVKDYFGCTVEAVREMLHQQQRPVFFEGKTFDDETALLQSGVIIRHLVLPGLRQDSIRILRYLAEAFDKDSYLLSIMSQFTPVYRCSEYKEINRRVTTFEYDSVVKEALRLGMDNTYIQGRDSVGTEYTPDFENRGILSRYDSQVSQL